MTAHLGDGGDPWDPERTFIATSDLRPPTVAEITGLYRESGAGTNAGTNLIAPGNLNYDLGRFFDFTTSTFSDDDVLYNRAQIKAAGTWRDLNLDPSTASGGANDGNADGYPGSRYYDEDADSTAAKADATDNDEDGLVDEIGEGIDFSDPEVHAAVQDLSLIHISEPTRPY